MKKQKLNISEIQNNAIQTLINRHDQKNLKGGAGQGDPPPFGVNG